MTSNPPMPLATIYARRSAISGEMVGRHFHGEIGGCKRELNKAARLLDFFLFDPVEGIEFFTSPAMRQSNAVASKWVIVAMPLRPASRFAQVSSVPNPQAQTSPTPVTTTRRFTYGSPA